MVLLYQLKNGLQLKHLTENQDLFDYIIERTDINENWVVSTNYAPLRNDKGDIIGAVQTLRDICERKKAEETLKESEVRFCSFFELSLIGIAITSPDKDWIEAHDKITEILGSSREELFKTTWEVITYHDDIDKNLEQFNKVLAGAIDSYSLEKRFIRKDGSVVCTIISVGSIRHEDNSVKYFVLLVEDISNLKKLENELVKSRDNLELKVQERTAELEIVIGELKNSNQELEQFVYVAAHDLQEPLRNIAGFSQLLERRYTDQLDSDAGKFIDYILNATKRMQQLISDLLKYSRITIKRKESVPVDVNEIVNVALSNLKVSIDENNAEIIYSNLPTVMADDLQLVQYSKIL